MLKSVLIISLISFCSHSVYGQKYGPMEPNRFSYLSVGQGCNYTSLKAGYDIKPNIYLEILFLSDGGRIWEELNRYNDWRSLSLLRVVNIAPLRSQLRFGVGIMHTSENTSALIKGMGVTPQISGVIRVHKKVAIGASVIWPIAISPAKKLILPTKVFTVEYTIGRYIKKSGLK